MCGISLSFIRKKITYLETLEKWGRSRERNFQKNDFLRKMTKTTDERKQYFWYKVYIIDSNVIKFGMLIKFKVFSLNILEV